jgi:hypothetical protein
MVVGEVALKYEEPFARMEKRLASEFARANAQRERARVGWVIGYCCLLFGPVQTGSGGYLLARKIRNMEMRGILVGLG